MPYSPRPLRKGEEPLDLSNPPTGYFSAVTPAPGPRPKFCSYCGSELKSSKCVSCGAVDRGER